MSLIAIPDLVYHLGYKCHLRCRGCVNYSNHQESQSLPWTTNWEQELTALNNRFEVSNLEIIGGEPLLHPNIKEIIEHAIALDNIKFTQLITNGLVLQKNLWLIPLLESYPNKFRVLVSYHQDPSKKTTFNIRMRENLAKFLNLSENKIFNIISRLWINGYSKGIVRTHVRYDNFIISIKEPDMDNGLQRWRYPQLDADELPMQFDNDPQEAYRDCICPWLHYVNGNIYKCGMTATLPPVLQAKNKPIWPLLKTYQPYSVIEEHNPTNFLKLKQAEDICKYCPVNSKNQWEYTKSDKFTKIMIEQQ